MTPKYTKITSEIFRCTESYILNPKHFSRKSTPLPYLNSIEHGVVARYRRTVLLIVGFGVTHLVELRLKTPNKTQI